MRQFFLMFPLGVFLVGWAFVMVCMAAFVMGGCPAEPQPDAGAFESMRATLACLPTTIFQMLH